jgi:lipopolysaccharide transport system permease protein
MVDPAVHKTPPRGRTPTRDQQGLGQLWVQRDLLWRFVVTDLRHRYVGSSLGFFWTVVTPILELVIYTFVFHGLIGVTFHPEGGWYHYALFLFSGMVTWYALADGLSRATTAVTDNAHLIKKVDFPTLLLPAHLVASAVLNQVIRIGILAIAALMLGHGVSWHLLLVPVFVALQAVLVLGMGLMLCTMQVFFRDTVHWVKSLLLLGMFVTPVFFPAAAYPERFKLLLQFNPMAHLVGVYHELLLNHRLPHPNSMLVPAVMAALSLAIGWSVYSRHRERFADLI